MHSYSASMPKLKHEDLERDLSNSEYTKKEDIGASTVVLHESKALKAYENALFGYLERIISLYDSRVSNDILSEFLVAQFYYVLSTFGLKTTDEDYNGCVNTYQFAMVNFNGVDTELDIGQILKHFSMMERSLNDFLHIKFGLAAANLNINPQSQTYVFNLLNTLNTMLTERRWSDLGSFLNNLDILRYAPRLDETRSFAKVNSKSIYREKVYQYKIERLLAHDTIPVAHIIWKAASLRILQQQVSREYKSSQLVDILRRLIANSMWPQQFPYYYDILNEAVAMLISLDECAMIRYLIELDLLYLQKKQMNNKSMAMYESYKLLAQAWLWIDDQRTLEGIRDPGMDLVNDLMSVAVREGPKGVVFVLAAIKGWNKIAAIENDTFMDHLSEYAVSCPLAVRPVAAQFKEYGMEKEANVLIDKIIRPDSSIHPSDPIWLEWADMRMEKYGRTTQNCNEIAQAMLLFLDYGSNRDCVRAWTLLDKALKGCDELRLFDWWEDRSDWWIDFHTVEMGKKGSKRRTSALARILSSVSQTISTISNNNGNNVELSSNY